MIFRVFYYGVTNLYHIRIKKHMNIFSGEYLVKNTIFAHLLIPYEYPQHMFLWRNKQNYPLLQNTLICSTG